MITVTGDVVADLFAATTGDGYGDWVVKLIDVNIQTEDAKADGRLPVDGGRGDSARAIQEELHEQPEAVKPGEVNEYRWSLHGVDHTFLKGHRLMVEVQSTWFPLYDRNPQTWVPNIMTAPAESYKAETVSIMGSAKYPSHLELPVMEGAAGSPQTVAAGR